MHARVAQTSHSSRALISPISSHASSKRCMLCAYLVLRVHCMQWHPRPHPCVCWLPLQFEEIWNSPEKQLQEMLRQPSHLQAAPGVTLDLLRSAFSASADEHMS